jgi:hypothetical protein
LEKLTITASTLLKMEMKIPSLMLFMKMLSTKCAVALRMVTNCKSVVDNYIPFLYIPPTVASGFNAISQTMCNPGWFHARGLGGGALGW